MAHIRFNRCGLAEEESLPDDLAIAGWIREGRPEAVAALLERYHDRLVAYAHRVVGDRHEAEDVVQEVFLRAPRARGLRDPRSLIGWLYAVSYRIAVDKLRQRNRRARALEALAPARDLKPVSSELEGREEAGRARAALSGLPEPYRSAVKLRYLEGLEFKEIAGRMGTIERTARTWVGRGLGKLREELGGRG
jgi:RNA polymerase sigma-70 factor (ECF subfamily)